MSSCPGVGQGQIGSPVHQNGKTDTKSFNGGKLARGLYWLNDTVNENNLTLGGCLLLQRDNICVYNHYFQTSSLKTLGKSMPNFMWSLLHLGSGKESLYKW